MFNQDQTETWSPRKREELKPEDGQVMEVEDQH